MVTRIIIEAAQTQWTASIVFVTEKNGTFQFSVDYCRINVFTKHNSCAVPHVHECVDSLCQAAMFFTLDASSGYWQVGIKDNDKDKTPFTTNHKLYRFVIMPFGLHNAPGAFHRTLDATLYSVKWQIALVYLDNIVIVTKTPEQHI